MARYTYECRLCKRQIEVIQSMNDSKFKIHSELKEDSTKCNGELDRLIECPAIVFKGEGWTPNFTDQRQRYEKLNHKLDDMGIKEQK